MNPRRIVCAATLLLCLSAGPVAWAAVNPASPTLQDDQHQAVVDHYAELLTYTTATDLDLQVAGLVTGDPSLFDRFLWVAIVTMPGGDMVAMHRSSNYNTGTASYSAAWENLPDNWIDSPGGQAYASYTVADVLNGTVGQNGVPDLSGAHSVTAFSVTASLNGQARTYGAAFVWYTDGDGNLAYVVADNIVAGAAELTIEELPASAMRFDVSGGLLDSAMTLEEGPVVVEPGPVEPGGCEPSSVVIGPVNRSDSDANDHAWGEHSAKATLKATCTCDKSCMGTCTADVSGTECKDKGATWWWCHKMTSDSSASVAAKHGGGASCAAGFSCSETHTWFCLGVKKIKVEITDVGGVEFEDDGGSDWSVTWPLTATCGPCTEAR